MSNLYEEYIEKKETKKNLNYGKLLVSYACIILGMICLFKFVLMFNVIPSSSMESTIMTGDFVIGTRFDAKDIERYDIMVFNAPDEPESYFIKRVIGLPGETLEIRDAKVYINHSDTPLDEPYLKENWVAMNDGLTYEIPEECYFVMGDNRNNSADGRYWAMEAVDYGAADSIEEAVENEYCFVRQDQILGKAIFRYFPKPTLLNQSPYEEDTDQ